MSDLFDLDYYSKEIANVINAISVPKFYKWLADEQFEYVHLKNGFVKTIKWDTFINKNPTTLTNELNAISTIGFRSEIVMLNYLRLQYRLRHINQAEEEFYTHDGYIGNANNNLLPFREAFKLASDEIIKIIDHFILTGTVTIKKDGKNQKRLLPNMYGLLNIPDQIKEDVEASNKDKMDKIFEKIEEGLSKLELGDEFSTPMMVLVDPKTSLKLVKSYAIPSSSNSHICSSTDSWEDLLIKTIKAVNNRKDVCVQTSNLLSNQILIYPLNAELIKFKPSKYMLPMPNEQIDKDSTDVAYSYLDFVLGGLIATGKSILRVNIKQS
ncbi:hypothetical protein [Borrelia miyamotoi]|uniref:Uncharacterized protein n=2 Tax=Borrelia miyamotoi TaxID=47466 RepID=A0AAQ2WXF7_9SPIR|nr:hypothetical protein [Borrelia miyamotoi]QTL84003.1 hypothetical protein bmLB2001_001262 [Borrelia miyamotoi]WAZ85638.1 hypothetical protein O5400_04625 [Borrelia miyamotoi]WAZ91421.1 hypothetical protein O5398_04620 [Borrelia miyamotoi]WAZ92708.1 hypothetical protein O5402_04625 [Borrelia miyamotoi]WAZ93999.1 hypothetical protein O5399_04630 [Borrelia miyamotoi]